MLKSVQECTGCAACAFICPRHAITMISNKQGFCFPKIDENACIHCGLCEKVCKQNINPKNEIKQASAFQSCNEQIIRNSSSGGAISEIAKQFLRIGGCVYSASYDRNNGARWIWVNDLETMKKITGSKYFQIPLLRDCYEDIEKKLITGTKVLFIGTPCQVAGIRKVIPEKYHNNLYLVDIVCGGVVSPLLEEKYIDHEEKKENCTITHHYFRSKESGWNRTYTTLLVTDKEKRIVKLGAEDLFIRAYTSGRYMRESCYRCEYASRFRVSDITVGDCWGIEKDSSIDPAIINKGVSLVVCNSDKGVDFINGLEKKMFLNVKNPLLFISSNKPLNKHSERPAMRNISYKLLNSFPLQLAINIVCYRRLIKKYLLRRNIL